MTRWEILKDIAEIAGTVGTAIGIGLRLLIKARVREEKTKDEIRDIMQQVENLKVVKLDKAVFETENKHTRELITDMRSDMRETSRDMSENMLKMSESLNKLDGTVRTFMDMIKNK